MGLQQITGNEIAAGSIAASDLASASITGDKLGATSINANNIVGGTITTTQIASNTISNTNIQTGAIENYSRATGLLSGMRNRIINGAMVISQYNGTSSNTPVNNGYPIDRFIYKSTQASKFTAQQVTTAPTGFINSLQLTVASAVTIGSSDFFAIGQRIEGLNLYDIGFGTAACKPTNLSFQVRSSLTGTFGGALTNAAGDASYAFTYTISSANTWTSISIEVPAVTTGTWVTNNSTCLQVWFGLGVGSTYNGTAGSWVSGNNFSATGATSVVATSGATFLVTGVQLEVGSTATSFDYRPYTTELQLCQRYFCKTYDIETVPGTVTSSGGILTTITNASIMQVTWAFPVNMRATPTVTAYNMTTGATGTWRDGGAVDQSITVSGQGQRQTSFVNFTGSAGSNINGHAIAVIEL